MSKYCFIAWSHNRVLSTDLGEGHSKKLTFCLRLQDLSMHSAFTLAEVSASGMPAILKKFLSKGATLKAVILNCTQSWQPGYVCVISFCRIDSKLVVTTKPATDFASFTRSAKYIFSSDYTLHFLSFGVWSMFGWKKKTRPKSSHNPEWKFKGSSEAIWTKWHHENAAWLLSILTATTMSNFGLPCC